MEVINGMIQCPYEMSHMIRPSRIQYHLLKCRRVCYSNEISRNYWFHIFLLQYSRLIQIRILWSARTTQPITFRSLRKGTTWPSARTAGSSSSWSTTSTNPCRGSTATCPCRPSSDHLLFRTKKVQFFRFPYFILTNMNYIFLSLF